MTGGSGTGAGAGFGMLGLGINSGLSQMQSRDPKTACGSTNPFSSGINFNGSTGYQNWIANGSGNRTENGFSLVATLGDIVNDTIWGGVGSAAQYGGGKLVEGLENFVSKRWNKSGTSSGKTDFYVTPSGDAIPSTGYRYTARNVNVIQSARRGSVAARRDGTYFSFDKMDDAIIAQGKLQIPYRPEYRIEFDTLDIIDDISIPKGNWGRANYLEPITKDFRIYGPGKATQAITYSEINSVTGIYKMR